MMDEYMTHGQALIKCSQHDRSVFRVRPQNVSGSFSRLLRTVLDLVLPPTCAGCGEVLGEPHTLCPACWSRLTFLTRPCCAACGHPFDYAVPELTLCGTCARQRPPYDRARAALLYDDASKDFILGFKHADQTDLSHLLAKWLAGAGGEVLADADMLVPVPLHWTRLVQRRYNQSALLAQALARLSGVPVAADTLVRSKKTPSQGGLGIKARARNVQGAFRVPASRRPGLEGRRVVLIDDVYTTGATVRAAAKVLRRAGAGGVDVLTLARVVKDAGG